MSSEFNKPQVTRKVKIHPIIASQHIRPFVDNPSQLIDVSVGDESDPYVKSNEPSDLKYEKVGSTHGRSRVESVSNKKVLYGQGSERYGSRDIKGAVMKDVHIETHSQHPYGVMVDGLMDDLMVERLFAASRVLRENGIATERPTKVSELKEIIVTNNGPSDKWRKISVDRWKLETLKRILSDSVSARKAGKIQDSLDKEDLYRRLEDYFKTTRFVAVERDLQVPERLSDVAHITNEDDFKKFLIPILNWVNAHYSSSGEKYKWSPTNKNIGKYFEYSIPTVIGMTLGRVHNLELVHGFCHNQNWSVVGSLYDLDGVVGPKLGLGDPKPLQEDYQEDISDTIDALTQTFIPGNFLYEKFPHILNHAIINFCVGYIREKFGTNITPEKLIQIRAYFRVPSIRIDGLIEDVWKTIEETLTPQN